MGPIAMALIGSAVSGIGQAVKNQQAERTAQEIAAARNQVLTDTLAQNDPLADASRASFDARMAAGAPTVAADAAANDARQAVMSTATAPMAAEPTYTSSRGPAVVNSAIADALTTATQEAQAEAAALGKVGSYGDAWFNQGVANQALGRDLRTNSNFAGGNLALLPHLQDLAQLKIKPKSGVLADVMIGAGNAIGSYGGSSGAPGGSVIPTTFQPGSTLSPGWGRP